MHLILSSKIICQAIHCQSVVQNGLRIAMHAAHPAHLQR